MKNRKNKSKTYPTGRTEIARLFCLDDTIAEQKTCDDRHKAKRNSKHTGYWVLHYQVVKGL